MEKAVSLFLLFVANICFAQNAKKQSEMNVKNKMEARQPQDLCTTTSGK